MHRNDHLLTRLSVPHPLQTTTPTPPGWEFDPRVGAWLDHHTRGFMVRDIRTPRFGTKKHDLETGEDAKGQ